MRQLFCITLGLFLFASTIYADNGRISLKTSFGAYHENRTYSC